LLNWQNMPAKQNLAIELIDFLLQTRVLIYCIFILKNKTLKVHIIYVFQDDMGFYFALGLQY